MFRYFLKLSYDGTNYNGWQIQENTANTIQQVLQDKISLLVKEKIEIVGCGRTDTGVHAKNYIAHFDLDSDILQKNKNHWLYKFNTILPPEIAVQDYFEVDNAAHARFDAISRTYYYFVHTAKNPFIEKYSYFLSGEPDFELMNKAAEILFKHLDFTSFSKLHTQTKTNNCKITKAVWQKVGIDQYRFTITSDRFLRGMVRAIVGTLLLVGKNKISLKEFENIILAKDRGKAGSNAPANALFLVGIKYPEDLFSE
ncbi:MAG: tRNA pseudouridine(38-40) synthase TruA [Bacteroidia bacterium]